jgi:hypothetical protein
MNQPLISLAILAFAASAHGRPIQQGVGNIVETHASTMDSSKLVSPVDQLSGKSDVDSVRFVMSIPYSEHRARLTEETLEKWGCIYETSDVGSVEQILDLLRGTQIKGAPVLDAGWEPRAKVLIKLKRGAEINFLFEQAFPHKANVSGSLNGAPITAPPALLGKLYRWASGTGIKTDCAAFIQSNAYSGASSNNPSTDK